MRKVDLLVFDLDGTLVDSVGDLAASVNHALSTLGLPTWDRDAIRRFVGDGVKALVQRAVGPARDHFDRAMELFSGYYGSHLLDQTALYPDVREVLDHFGAKKKVIVTNKLERFTLKIVRGLGIDGRFVEIIGEDTTPFKKPDPRLLELVMEKWGATKERTVVIGDGINDVLLGRNAGALSCAFLNGITERGQLLALDPDMTCEALAELKTMFE
jgi:phosphoglycolate phosphatase